MGNIQDAVETLDEWLETMKQENGYAGPVSHWWQSSYRFCGPALDWRYEGIITGYLTLWEKTRLPQWRHRIETAVHHLMEGRSGDGSLANSRFEANPGTLGTPHEASACVGLLRAATVFGRDDIGRAAITTLEHLIHVFWDNSTRGFNDAPDAVGRVPNKLATLAEAFFAAARYTRSDYWLDMAGFALEDIVRLQIRKGPRKGAVHQWGRGPRLRGDGRLFPFYNARCVPALVEGSELLGVLKYREAAEHIVDFLDRFRNDDGSWPQLVYSGGRKTEYPRWVAPTADILYAYHSLGRPVPPQSLKRLLRGQLASGGFITAEGFKFRHGRHQGEVDCPDYLDITPVVGWNDKVLRLLTIYASTGGPRSESKRSTDCVYPVTVGTGRGWYYENDAEMSVTTNDGCTLFHWDKRDVWAKAVGMVP